MSDDEFWSELLKLRKYLFTVAFKIGVPFSQIEDLTHTTMIKAFEARASFIEGSNLKNWVVVIMKNHNISQARKRIYRGQYREKRLPKNLGNIISDGKESLPDSRIELAETLSLIRAASIREREALLLFINGSSYKEAAKKLGISVNTLRSRIRKVREFIRGSKPIQELMPEIGQAYEETIREIDAILEKARSSALQL